VEGAPKICRRSLAGNAVAGATAHSRGSATRASRPTQAEPLRIPRCYAKRPGNSRYRVETACVEFIDETGGGAGVRLRKAAPPLAEIALSAKLPKGALKNNTILDRMMSFFRKTKPILMSEYS
jgi:hypothetical protein